MRVGIGEGFGDEMRGVQFRNWHVTSFSLAERMGCELFLCCLKQSNWVLWSFSRHSTLMNWR